MWRNGNHQPDDGEFFYCLYVLGMRLSPKTTSSCWKHIRNLPSQYEKSLASRPNHKSTQRNGNCLQCLSDARRSSRGSCCVEISHGEHLSLAEPAKLRRFQNVWVHRSLAFGSLESSTRMFIWHIPSWWKLIHLTQQELLLGSSQNLGIQAKMVVWCNMYRENYATCGFGISNFWGVWFLTQPACSFWASSMPT